MKSFGKTLLSLALVVTMLLSSIVTVSATDTTTEEADAAYEITVDGTTFTSDQNASGNGWEYETANNAVFLKGYNGGPISAKGDLRVSAYVGDSSKINGADGTDGGDGIWVEGRLDLNGIADLEIAGGNGDSGTGTGGAGIRADTLSVYSADGTLKVSGGSGATGGSGIVANTVWINSRNIICGGETGGAGVEISSYCSFSASESLVTGQPALKLGDSASWWYNSDNATKEETETRICITPNTYTTTLDGNGGTLNGEASLVDSRKYDSESIDLSSYPFEREGYKLIGWSESQACEEPEYSTTGSYWPDADKTLYAQWLAVGEKAVLLYCDSGAFEDGAQFQKMSGDTVTLPGALTYSGDNYTLLGWTTDKAQDSDGTYKGDCYLPGETIETDPSGALCLYAIEVYSWMPAAVYHPNGGALERGGSVLIQSGWGSTACSSGITAPEGMELFGWASSKDGEVEYLPGISVTNESAQRLELYAIWQEEGTVRQLDTPTDLTWVTEPGEESDSYDNVPGTMRWQISALTQGIYDIKVYRMSDDGDDELVGGTRLYTGQSYGAQNFLAIFITDIEQTGSYYFTIQTLGDGNQYTDSEIATSEIWNYTAPEAQLSVPDGLMWEDGTMKWTAPDFGQVGYYEVQIWYAATEADTPLCCGGSTIPVSLIESFNEYPELEDHWIEMHGAGLYYFKVRALSGDINTWRSGEWSELSPAYDLREVSERVNSALDEIISADTSDKMTTIKAVQNMDTDDLATAMSADTDGTGAASKIEALESAIGVTATVTVTTEASAFNSADNISVVGAGLNAQTADQRVSLKIDRPEKDHVLETQYSNSVAFSMKLVDGNNDEVSTEGKKLDVPVKITLPVPASINPQFLVVLHHHTDSTTEELHPYVTQDENGNWYATFVVTSFSDFELVNPSVVALEDKISVSASMQSEADIASVFCAVYDAAGKQLGIGQMTQSGDLWTAEITCAPALVDHVKVFALNSQNQPVADAKTITATAITK